MLTSTLIRNTKPSLDQSPTFTESDHIKVCFLITAVCPSHQSHYFCFSRILIYLSNYRNIGCLSIRYLLGPLLLLHQWLAFAICELPFNFTISLSILHLHYHSLWFFILTIHYYCNKIYSHELNSVSEIPQWNSVTLCFIYQWP